MHNTKIISSILMNEFAYNNHKLNNIKLKDGTKHSNVCYKCCMKYLNYEIVINFVILFQHISMFFCMWDKQSMCKLHSFVMLVYIWKWIDNWEHE
jgi:hypothetical protein